MSKRKSFVFVDLAEQTDGPKPFDGMAVGVFTDMRGRPVVIKREELPVYVANTQAALASTADSSGRVIGFPIDALNHNHGEAAGWIVGVQLSDRSEDIIQFIPRWNERGLSLINGDIMRFFSPNLDLETKTITGGSLTNYPASRTRNGQILLKPIELSEQMYAGEGLDLADTLDELKAFITGLFTNAHVAQGEEQALSQPPIQEGVTPMPEPTEQVLPETAELTAAQQTALESLVETRAKLRFQGWLEQEQRKAEVIEFARTVTGKGIPVPADDLTAFLSSLTADQLGSAKAILAKIAETGTIDFVEHGHSRTLSGAQPLPDWAKPLLAKWIEAGNELSGFFSANAVELGNQSDYNLSEFEQEAH
jgi:hypothetical protein